MWWKKSLWRNHGTLSTSSTCENESINAKMTANRQEVEQRMMQPAKYWPTKWQNKSKRYFKEYCKWMAKQRRNILSKATYAPVSGNRSYRISMKTTTLRRIVTDLHERKHSKQRMQNDSLMLNQSTIIKVAIFVIFPSPLLKGRSACAASVALTRWSWCRRFHLWAMRILCSTEKSKVSMVTPSWRGGTTEVARSWAS